MALKLSEISKFIDKHKTINGAALRDEFCASILQKTARDTPVDTGRATANWTAQAREPDLSPKRFRDQSKSATITRQRAEKAIRAASDTDDIYITNAVQGENEDGSFTGEGYIIGLERGKSVQSSAGMMFNKNVALAKPIADNARRKIFS